MSSEPENAWSEHLTAKNAKNAKATLGSVFQYRAWRSWRAWLTREELLHEVWGYHSMPSTRTVDVHVAWLRQKIEPNPRHPQFILTVHGMGYKFAG